ncbi:MAG: divalent-cation tolerance protein CutA [Promethearchaeota archaeon]
MLDALIFFVTAPNLEEGNKIARLLVEQKIVACINIIQNVISIYWWKEKIEEDSEVLLIIKTNKKNAKRLMAKIKEIHPYDTPECISVEVNDGLKSYLEWINQVTE